MNGMDLDQTMRVLKENQQLKDRILELEKENEMLKNLKDIHPMEYSAQSPEEIELMRELNRPLRALYDQCDAKLPECADKTVLQRKFQELRTQINQTIALNGIKKDESLLSEPAKVDLDLKNPGDTSKKPKGFS